LFSSRFIPAAAPELKLRRRQILARHVGKAVLSSLPREQG
jgi:hypothetical protein